MGWASGSRLFGGTIDTIKSYVADATTRKLIYKELISAFEDFDWDTQDECLGVDDAFDAALYELHPHWKDDDD